MNWFLFELFYGFIFLLEYNVEIVDNHVVLVARKQDLEKLERLKIPDELEIEPKPLVAIIGAGAGKYSLRKIFLLINPIGSFFKIVQLIE